MCEKSIQELKATELNEKDLDKVVGGSNLFEAWECADCRKTYDISLNVAVCSRCGGTSFEKKTFVVVMDRPQ